MDFFKKLFESDFMPHGHCYFWKPEIVYTNAISDGIIALAYMTIPLSLVYIVRARKDFNYYWLLVLFAIFILGCGTTHVMDVINIWTPYYRIDSVIRAITALASIGTAAALIKYTPHILLIPNAEVFKNLNNQLKDLNKTLEDKVQERTKDLVQREAELRDLTEKLKKRESQLKLITDTIPAYIAYVDKQEVYQFSNDYYKKTLMFSHPDTLGKNVKDVLGETTYKISKPFIQKALEGNPCTFENVVKKNNGDNQVLNISYVPDVNDFGVQGFVVMAVDISDRIEHENQLKLKNKELLKINNDLDNFIYTASHDLKSPISNMEGLLITIREEIEGQLYGEISEMFEMLEQSVLRLKGTISELANISQIQKNIDEDQSILSIADFITDFQKDYGPQIKETGTLIKSFLDVPHIFYSQRNFRSILYNILSNAIKYKKENLNPVIVIRTERLENQDLLLSISDNGMGLDLHQQKKLFGMFKRFHSHVEGSGVGLYIVKRIIENSGDHIEVESETGKGTIFRIYFKNQHGKK